MRIEAFSKTYGTSTVLRFPEHMLAPGKICAVIGANGSGKSTLAKVLAGIEQPDGKRNRIVSGRVGYLPQKCYAFRMRLIRNLLLNGKDENRAFRLMEALQIRSLSQKRANRLSGGETARMALARLLMNSYDLVILDEPTAAMDMESTSRAEKLIRNYVNETGCALMLVTHSLQQARRIADDVIFLDKGALIESGTASTVLYSPAEEMTRHFLAFYGFGEEKPVLQE